MKLNHLSSIAPFEKHFYALQSKGHSVGRCFADFLECTVSSFIRAITQEEKDRETVLEIAKRYGDHYELFGKALDDLIQIMEEEKKDYLGDFYMHYVTGGENGQYFTPPHVCDLISELAGETEGTTQDPACGSGRMLLASHFKRRGKTFYGADLDRRCCLMSVINLFLNGATGIIEQKDSVSGKSYDGRAFGVTGGVPYIFRKKM